jgi:hypothetical protein
VLLSLETAYKSLLLRELALQVRDTLLHAVNLIVQLLQLRILGLHFFLGLGDPFVC